jgi:hypothetical protein
MEATMKIKVLDKAAIPLLEDMAQRRLLRIELKQKRTARRTTGEMKPSERFIGCLTSRRVAELQSELSNMRGEWERTIS